MVRTDQKLVQAEREANFLYPEAKYRWPMHDIGTRIQFLLFHKTRAGFLRIYYIIGDVKNLIRYPHCSFIHKITNKEVRDK